MAWIVRKADNVVITMSGDPNNLTPYGVVLADVHVFDSTKQTGIADMVALIGSGDIRNPQTPYRHWDIAADLLSVGELSVGQKNAADTALNAAQALKAAKAAWLQKIRANTEELIRTSTTVSSIQTVRSGEPALISQVIAASSIAEVEAVTDSRSAS